jgi:hypothetical protein
MHLERWMWRSSRRRRCAIAAAAAVVALAGAGCGETNIQAIARLRPAFAVHRDVITAVVRDLPPSGSLEEDACFPEGMIPPVAFFERSQNDPRATAEILEVEELSGGRAPMSLSIRSPLHFCLSWTGPKNPLSPEVWDDRGGLGQECGAALRRPWLVLLRTVEHKLPERLLVEGFVVHLPTRRLVAWFPVEVRGNADGGAAEASHADFYRAFEYEMWHQLERLPGARVELDRGRYLPDPSDRAVPASKLPRSAPPLQVPGEPAPQAPEEPAPEEPVPQEI